MKRYRVTTGDAYVVKADNPEDAAAKAYAYIAGEPCPCQAAWCDCIGERDINTIVQEIRAA